MPLNPAKNFWNETIKKYSLENKNELLIEEVINPTKFFNIQNNQLLIISDKKENVEILESLKLKLQDIYNEISHSNITLKFITSEDKNEYLENKSVDENQLNTEFSFKNYVVGDFNKNAFKLMNSIVKNGSSLFNPIFIHSRTGLGKTHLVTATANEYCKNFNDRKLIYVESQKFVREVFKCFEESNNGVLIEQLKEKYIDCDVLIIDDIQLLADKNKTNEILFTIFNNLINDKKIIIMTSDRPPHELNGFEDRMISRFSSGISCKIDIPDSNSIKDIVDIFLKEKDIILTESALSLIETYCDSDIRKLLGLLNRIIFFSEQQGSDNTLDEMLVKNILDIDNRVIGNGRGGRYYNPTRIIEYVAKVYNIKSDDIKGNSRKQNIVMCRHIVMFIMRAHAGWSLKDIGNFLGNRDHTTVISGIEKIRSLKMNDKDFSKTITDIIKKI